jgi:hypothetical protein
VKHRVRLPKSSAHRWKNLDTRAWHYPPVYPIPSTEGRQSSVGVQVDRTSRTASELTTEADQKVILPKGSLRDESCRFPGGTKNLIHSGRFFTALRSVQNDICLFLDGLRERVKHRVRLPKSSAHRWKNLDTRAWHYPPFIPSRRGRGALRSSFVPTVSVGTLVACPFRRRSVGTRT